MNEPPRAGKRWAQIAALKKRRNACIHGQCQQQQYVVTAFVIKNFMRIVGKHRSANVTAFLVQAKAG